MTTRPKTDNLFCRFLPERPTWNNVIPNLTSVAGVTVNVGSGVMWPTTVSALTPSWPEGDLGGNEVHFSKLRGHRRPSSFYAPWDVLRA